MDQFAKDFLWGAASSSYQIEGGARADGKGESIWDAYAHTPGAVQRGETGDIACDHYHRAAEDVALMREIGLRAYRFSLCWPRLLPTGTGPLNAAGLAFYDRLVDDLLAAGITPCVTLFHWDYPLALYERGGWLNRDSAAWFGDYAALAVRHLGDRVTTWMTVNEPSAFVAAGHFWGVHAPGVRYDVPLILRMMLNVHRAHGTAVQALRAAQGARARIGMAMDGFLWLPETPDDEDAAREMTFSIHHDRDVQANPLWMDVMIWGRYPDAAWALFGPAMPEVTPDDLTTIAQPLDFFGVNAYTGKRVRRKADGAAEVVPAPPGTLAHHSDWEMRAETLYYLPKWLYKRYGLPIMITENGVSLPDWVALDGCVHDPQRIDYMQRYLRSLARALAEGTDIRGYFHWSLMDNFEWQSGYGPRMGLVHIDYTTLKRTPKDSAYWYRDLIASNGALLWR